MATPLGFRRSLAEAAVIAASASALALVVNAVRPAGLPIVAVAAYETLVPCPEPGGPVTPLDPHDPVLTAPSSFVIDARGEAAFAEGHLEGAVAVAYDWLDPLPDATLDALARSVAASRAARVVCYGDGGDPDSGEYLGRELSARGIRNVHYVRGGAPALLGREGS